MAEETTIQLKREAVRLLKSAKEYPRQTYNELVTKMAKLFLNVKKHNQYDAFLHKVQQAKMKELWDNKEDEIWDHV